MHLLSEPLCAPRQPWCARSPRANTWPSAASTTAWTYREQTADRLGFPTSRVTKGAGQGSIKLAGWPGVKSYQACVFGPSLLTPVT